MNSTSAFQVLVLGSGSINHSSTLVVGQCSIHVFDDAAVIDLSLIQ